MCSILYTKLQVIYIIVSKIINISYYLSSFTQFFKTQMDQKEQTTIFQKAETNKFSIFQLIQNSRNQRKYNNSTTIKVEQSLNALIKTMSKSRFFLKRLSQDILIQQDRRDLIDPNNLQGISAYTSSIITFTSFRKKTQSFVNVFKQFIYGSFDLLRRIQMFDDYLMEQINDLMKNPELYRNKKIKIASKIKQNEEGNKAVVMHNEQIFRNAFDFELQTLENIANFHEYIEVIHQRYEPLVLNLIDDYQSKRCLLVTFFSIKLELIQKNKDFKSKQNGHDLLSAQIQQLVKKRKTINDELKTLNVSLCQQQKELKENLQLFYNVRNIYKFEIEKFKKYRKMMRKGRKNPEKL